MDGRRGEREPVDSHTADTGRRGIRESPRLDSDSERILNLKRWFDKDEYSASSLIHEISLASTESYSITAKTLEKAKNYLKDNADNVKKLKELLVNQALLLKDKTNNQLIQESFKGSKLYDYDLSKYQHTDDDVNKVINNIVYTLKYINNIYLIVLNNESDKKAFKSLYENDKYTLNQEELNKLKEADGSSGASEAPGQPPTEQPTGPQLKSKAVPDTLNSDNVRNILQEFIRIYNYIVPKNYKLKEQNGDNFEQLQYETKLTMLLTPAFGKDRRWFDKWDKENDKGDITNNMSNILTSINDIIINLNDKKKIDDTTYINEQLTKLNSFIIEAKSYIKAEKYEEKKRDIIKKNKDDYINVKYLIINFVETYNKRFTADTISQEENETTITELKYKISIQGRDSKYTKPINYINEKIKALQIIKDKPTEVKGKDFQDALKNLEGSITSAKNSLFLSGGNPPIKYKSTGITVYILYEKKKYKRTVYTKDNRKTKYCKINNKYMLLSKLNVVE